MSSSRRLIIIKCTLFAMCRALISRTRNARPYTTYQYFFIIHGVSGSPCPTIINIECAFFTIIIFMLRTRKAEKLESLIILFNIAFYLIALLPVVLIVALAYVTYYNIKVKLIRRVQYQREFSVRGAFEGEELIITETIYNNSALPIFFIDIESYIHNNLKLENQDNSDGDSAMQLIISRFHLMPYMQVKRQHKIKCTRRGHYRMNTARIVTKNKTTYFNFDVELYVYPKAVELNQISYPVNFMQGDSISKRRVMQDPFSVSGIRDYASGDPFNMINFKATAKSGFQGIQSIKINKLEYCSDRIFMIYINFQTSAEILSIPTYIYENLMEQALSFAASFISEALRKGYRVGLSANCHLSSGERQLSFPIIGGLYHIEEILREMAKVQIRCGVSFESLLDGGTRADIYNAEIFIITPYADKSIDNSIAVLRKRNNAVTVVELENEQYTRFLSSVGKS